MFLCMQRDGYPVLSQLRILRAWFSQTDLLSGCKLRHAVLRLVQNLNIAGLSIYCKYKMSLLGFKLD